MIKYISAFTLGCASVLLALGVAIWLKPNRYDTGWYVTGYQDIYFLDTNDPKVIQERTKALYADLRKLSIDKLNGLRPLNDVCRSDDISCYGLPQNKVRNIIDIAISAVQTQRSNELADQLSANQQRSYLIALGSLAISGLAFLVSAATFFRR